MTTTEPDTAADDTVDTADTEQAGTRSKRPWIVLAVLVVLLASTVGTGLLWLSDRADESERTTALEAARSAAVALTSIKSDTAEQDIQRVIDAGTGEFGDLFRQNLDPYVRMVRDSQVASSGAVTSAAVSTVDNGKAQVIVAMKGTVRNASSPQEQQRLYRMRLEMVKEGDRWLVSKLEFVG